MRRHPSFWRHTKWWDNTYPLMEFVKTIYISDFEMKLVSDNGLANNYTEDDLVYVSDEQERINNEYDEQTFKIHSGISAAEAAEKKIQVKAWKGLASWPDGRQVRTIYDVDSGETAHPEELWIDEYYNRLSVKKLRVETTWNEDPSRDDYDYALTVCQTPLYRLPRLGKNFQMVGLERDLMAAKRNVTLLEK